MSGALGALVLAEVLARRSRKTQPLLEAGRQLRHIQRGRSLKRVERRLAEAEAQLGVGAVETTNGSTLPSSSRGEREDRARLFQLARPLTPMLAVETDSATYFVSSADQGPGRSLFVDRQRQEMDTLRLALKTLNELGHSGMSAGAFLDVGANIGTSTIPALVDHGFARAIACEPDPDNYRLLELNVQVNGLHDRVVSLQKALSDEEGFAELARSKSNWGDHRLLENSSERPSKLAKRELLSIERTTIDGLIRDLGLAPVDIGLVWIDAQGHEPQILAGAQALLASGTPVVFEYSPKALRSAADRTVRIASLLRIPGELVDLRERACAQNIRPMSYLEDLLEGTSPPVDLLLIPTRTERP